MLLSTSSIPLHELSAAREENLNACKVFDVLPLSTHVCTCSYEFLHVHCSPIFLCKVGSTKTVDDAFPPAKVER